MSESENGNNTELAPKQAKQRVESDEAQLIDVREPYEWEAGRIAGAVHIELDQLSGRANEIDQSRPVVFQCRTGERSAMARDIFLTGGYDAYNLAGGIQAWVEAGLEIEPEGGEVAPHGQMPPE